VSYRIQIPQDKEANRVYRNRGVLKNCLVSGDLDKPTHNDEKMRIDGVKKGPILHTVM
jgi:hypothetical protein